MRQNDGRDHIEYSTVTYYCLVHIFNIGPQQKALLPDTEMRNDKHCKCNCTPQQVSKEEEDAMNEIVP